jgi:hypothetical protein
VQRQELRRVMTLKNGGKIDPTLGLVFHGILETILEKNSDAFHALLAIAQGQSESVSPSMEKHLKKCLLLKQDGSIADEFRDVLLSGYQKEPGPMMINPFRLESKEQTRELESHEDENYRRLARWIRNGGLDKSDGQRR